MKSRTWSLALLAGVAGAAGAMGTIALGAAEGMHGDELFHLAVVLLPAVIATAGSVALAGSLLLRATLRLRLVAIALVGAVVSVVNLAVLARLMFLTAHDAAQIGILLFYSAAAGVGASLALSRHSARAVTRLTLTARALGDGDLDARVGRLGAGAELDALAAALDEMAHRLQGSLGRERAAEAMRRDLITAVSHDLRTPLAGLRAMAEAIGDGVVDDPPTIRRYIIEMRRSISSLSVLIDDLFELVQLEAGAIEAEKAKARLEDVVASALAACEGQAVEKGVTLETRLDGTSDAQCSPRLVRVLQNLLQNAIRHTPVDGTVWIEARQGPGGLEVAVQDTGEGIDPALLPRVFEPFWRGDPARSGPGSGLGLTLVRRIVEAMGGEIRAESDPARGARFSLLLPNQVG
jgi:signal transduction histidine kinase